ncbi:Membrane metallo-endopeptidase-like 1 [Melipona quadrifasciata]|uniref:Membrane metallo-endopeptidase-like 1 n=1 Tax=Melipona quadrifasciata TaxID=166423 RepID=A0A0M9AAP7_9HYME|nr:Membrane metallo-endopeptidase-like 1 [Melipona quadrifasciata]
MQLPWLICHLTIITAAPVLSPSLFLRVWRIVNTTNDTDADQRENREHRVCESAYCYEIATCETRSLVFGPNVNITGMASGTMIGPNRSIPTRCFQKEDFVTRAVRVVMLILLLPKVTMQAIMIDDKSFVVYLPQLLHQIVITCQIFHKIKPLVSYMSKKIQQNRDTTADPCENFYQYACGSWSRHNPIPDNEVEWSEDHIIIEKTNRRIRELLEEHDSPTDIPPVKMARKFYRSCMNVDAIEKRGIKPIQEILDRTGGWPMAMPLKEWDPKRISWQKIDKEYVTLIGNSAFYNIEYEVDLNNTKRYVLTIDQETESSFSSKTDVNDIFSDNTRYSINIFRIVQAFAREKGYTLNLHQLVTDIVQMIYFEVKLLQIFETGKETHIVSDNYKRMTIRELQKYYNSFNVTSSITAKIDFLEMIQHAFNLANVRINSSEPVVVYNPEFLDKLARLLASTSRRVLVNYVQWNMVDLFLPYTTQEMRDIKFNMSLLSYNISNYTPRWQVCVLSLRMKNAVAYMFVKKYISEHVIQEARSMVKKIKDELKSHIGQAHWLSSSMRVKLMQKLDNLETQIGYPDWYRDNEAVTRYYERTRNDIRNCSQLRIGSDYFENILNSEKNELIKNLEQFRQVVARDQWSDFPTTVNSFYAETVNAIPAELQDPYFSSHLPDAINYGATGFVIGHELSHGFDNEGIQFDKDGYKMEWTSECESQYEERSMCFVDQYDNYTLDITNEDGDPVMSFQASSYTNKMLLDLAGWISNRERKYSGLSRHTNCAFRVQKTGETEDSK